MTARRFRVLVAALPPDSAFGAFLRDKKRRDLVDVTVAEELFEWLS